MEGNNKTEETEQRTLDIKKPEVAEIVRDEVWLICTVAKWVFFSILSGVTVGLVAGGFLVALRIAMKYAAMGGKAQYLLLFPGLAVSYYLVRLLAPESAGHGTDAVIAAIHNRTKTVIDMKTVPVKIISTIVTISSGGSVGTEGPCAQIGSGVAYVLGKIFRLDESDLKKIIICGMAA
ncbi:MAG: chloride channel protein, partial [Synergistes sp.]|nr:chloride channel protein [Synergistes sp.]